MFPSGLRGHQDLINVQGFSVCHCGKMKVQLHPSMEGFPTGASLGLSFPSCRACPSPPLPAYVWALGC